jgi:hypothetical protein
VLKKDPSGADMVSYNQIVFTCRKLMARHDSQPRASRSSGTAATAGECEEFQCVRASNPNPNPNP